MQSWHLASQLRTAEPSCGPVGSTFEVRSTASLTRFVSPMRAHGYLPSAERRAVAEQALVQVVGPVARALLSRDTPTRAHESAELDDRSV